MLLLNIIFLFASLVIFGVSARITSIVMRQADSHAKKVQTLLTFCLQSVLVYHLYPLLLPVSFSAGLGAMVALAVDYKHMFLGEKYLPFALLRVMYWRIQNHTDPIDCICFPDTLIKEGSRLTGSLLSEEEVEDQMRFLERRFLVRKAADGYLPTVRGLKHLKDFYERGISSID